MVLETQPGGNIALDEDGMTSEEDRQRHPRCWEPTGWGDGDGAPTLGCLSEECECSSLRGTNAQCAALLRSINADSCLVPGENAHCAALMRSMKADGSGFDACTPSKVQEEVGAEHSVLAPSSAQQCVEHLFIGEYPQTPKRITTE